MPHPIHSPVLLFDDDTAIHCSPSSTTALQIKLNNDLCRLKDRLNLHKLTLNISKSKFMLISGTKQLHSFSSIEPSFNDNGLEEECSHKHLGMITNQTLSWSEDMEYDHRNVAETLGVLMRIKYSRLRES